MVVTWNTSVELSLGEEDWIQTRDCFVRAFQNYPLYTYLIPNEDKRPEFLKQYLEAIYDVLVRNGSSILVCVKLSQNEECTTAKKSVIGGVLFVPPSSKGGWESRLDKDFLEAYRKYGLKDLDEEALKRIEKYEEWEYETISKHIFNSGIPMWNGVICGIDPTYAGRGCGSLNYVHCLNTLAQALQSGTKASRAKKIFKRIYEKLWSRKLEKKALRKSLAISHSQTSAILAISHCTKAVHFHKKNGFYRVADMPFMPNKCEVESSSFTATVLMLSMDSDISVALSKEFQLTSKSSHLKVH